MALKNPREFFYKEEDNILDESIAAVELSSNFDKFSGAFNSYKNNVKKIESISQTLDQFDRIEELDSSVKSLQEELTKCASNQDLDNAMLAHIVLVEETIRKLQENIKGINKSSLKEIKTDVVNLNQLVENLIEVEIPKYRKYSTKIKIKLGEDITTLDLKLGEVENLLKEQLENVEGSVKEKFNDFIQIFENYSLTTDQKIQEEFSGVKQSLEDFYTTKIPQYNKSILDHKIKNEKTISELSQKINESLEDFSVQISKIEKTSTSGIESINVLIGEKIQHFEKIYSDVVIAEEVQENLVKKITDLEIESERNQLSIRNYNKNYENLVENVQEVLTKLNIDELQRSNSKLTKKITYLEEVFKKFNESTLLDDVQKDIKSLQEGLLNEPPSSDNEDPLTPLDQNFVTLDQLQDHYRIFINRIQQQLSTLGGGGETQLKYLDDIVGIATNPAAYDGKFLGYNHSIKKFVFQTISGGGGGSGDYSNVAGIATFAVTAGTATTSTYSSSSGLSTYSNVAGIATFAVTAGTATTSTYSSSSGIATFAGLSGVSTALQNSRTFQITGDIIASPISFNGTGNVSLAATIQPNSVALGTDTAGDYVQSLSGTVNQIDISGGTGEGSTPVISIVSNPTLFGNVTISNDLQVNNNLNVTGNITVGGTTAYIITNDFRISDADIVLGFTTDSYGNAASNDTTANHGGVAVASTEGNPLVTLYNPSVGETLPATYKKIMWFKSGSFAGLNTDAWLINYAVGIGSTQFPAGTRLAAGAVQFTEQDLAVVRNINASGVVTASSFIGNASSATYASSAGISTYAPVSGLSTFATTAGTATTATYASVSGLSTYSSVSGIATYASVSGLSTYSSVSGIATYASTTGISTNVIGGIASVTQLNVSGISTLGQITGTTANFSGVVTATRFIGDGSNITGITAGISTYSPVAGIATNVIGGIASVTQLQVTGISTLGIVSATIYYGKVLEKVITVTTNYTILSTDSVIKTNGTLNLFLPQTAGSSGDKYFIKNIGIGTVTLVPFGSETIDSYTTYQLTDFNTSITIISDNTAWTIH